MIYVEDYPQYQKDLKKLLKRYGSLKEDIEILKSSSIELHHSKAKIDNGGIKEIKNIKSNKFTAYKVKKFACKSLKGEGNRSGLRPIYTFCPLENKITFIELYHKQDKENEDKERLNSFLKE